MFVRGFMLFLLFVSDLIISMQLLSTLFFSKCDDSAMPNEAGVKGTSLE